MLEFVLEGMLVVLPRLGDVHAAMLGEERQ